MDYIGNGNQSWFLQEVELFVYRDPYVASLRRCLKIARFHPGLKIETPACIKDMRSFRRSNSKTYFINQFCQNPNLTTTQPNLNLVGFDMIIAFHTTTPPSPHHTTGNSTSTRDKGPSGLKFCMGPHLTKLRGGGLTNPSPGVNPYQ